MKSKDFLRSKGILSNDSHHFIIDFHDGREINLGDLLEEYAQQSQPSGMRWVRASERPFSVELLWNDEFHPGESAISWMGKDEYDKFNKEYKAKEDAVLFTNTRVEYDSCDCGGEYGCSHGSWPITIHFGNNPESCKGDFEDEATLVLYGTKNAVTVHDYTKITIGQFVEICDIVGIVLHIKPEWLDESSPAGAAEGASEGMAEALRLKWINLTEDMGRLLSGQRGVSIDKLNKAMNLVQEFVNTLPASLSSPGSGWVKVDYSKPETLPEFGLDVFVYAPEEKDPFIIDHCFKGSDGNIYWDWCNNPDTHKPTVTHWRPLPAPPGE